MTVRCVCLLLGSDDSLGLGIGVGFQIGILVVQNMLPLEWIPVATACVQFFQSLGGAVFIAVSQALFQNGLKEGIMRDAPGIPPEIFINSGASQVKQVLQSLHAEQFTDAVLNAYLSGLRHTYYASMGCAGAAFVISCLLTWKKIKKTPAEKEVGHSDIESGGPDAGKVGVQGNSQS